MATTMATFQNIYFLIILTITCVGALFQIYNHFKNPQTKLEKKQALDNQHEESRVEILEAQLKWEKESSVSQFKQQQEGTDRRFLEINNRVGEFLKLEQNHIHTLDTKVEDLKSTVTTMTINVSTELAQLRTIINERIPCKETHKMQQE